MLRSPFIAGALWLAALLCGAPAQAQTTAVENEFPTATSTQIPGESASSFARTQAEATRSDSSSSSLYRPDPSAQARVSLNGGEPLPVFGTDLFSGAFAAARPGQSSEYEIQPGDQIAVRIYGALNSDAVQTVDSQGRLFIQGVGPVTVGGFPASQVQRRVREAISQVFTEAVSVYANVLQGGTLGVFVTGDVIRPGRYVGSPSDSVLYFLDQAGGIDPLRGSFRDIQVIRRGQNLSNYDLYSFLISGSIESFRFEDGDVVLVGPRGALVGVTGEVRNAYAFEAAPRARQISGRDLLVLARPDSAATAAAVTSVRNGSRVAGAYTLQQLAGLPLGDGDQVEIRADVFTEQISVTLEGDLRGPSAFALPRGSRLSQLLAQVPLDGADIATEYVHIERRSVARQQKAALDAALDDLERAALTAPALSSDAAALRASEAALVSRYVAQARGAEPSGKVAVYTNGQFNDLKLESGDVVVFPSRTDVVVIAGEVLSPGAFVHAGGLRVKDYVNRAGGFAANANKKRFVLRRPDGSALVVNGGERPRPGDEIVVTPSFGNRTLQIFKDLTQIAFQIATSTAAVINITDR
jgi:protein involved in polysaccharide export with SLBB domain